MAHEILVSHPSTNFPFLYNERFNKFDRFFFPQNFLRRLRWSLAVLRCLYLNVKHHLCNVIWIYLYKFDFWVEPNFSQKFKYHKNWMVDIFRATGCFFDLTDTYLPVRIMLNTQFECNSVDRSVDNIAVGRCFEGRADAVYSKSIVQEVTSCRSNNNFKFFVEGNRW